MALKLCIYKNIFVTALLIFICLVPSSLYAQSGISYQAIARTGSGDPMATTSINVEFKIHQSAATGSVVYHEKHNNAATNTYGLFTLVIGQGSVVSGNFLSINWGAGPFFLEVFINGAPVGTTQFLSVPYSFFSAKSANDIVAATPPLTISSGTISMANPLPISNGGTGATVSTTALNNLLPPQLGNGSKVLTTDGTYATWQLPASSTLLTGTANYFPKWNSSGNGLTPSSLISDDGTKITVASGNMSAILDVGCSTKLGAAGVKFSAMIPGMASVDPPSIGPNQMADILIPVPGLAVGDYVLMTPPHIFGGAAASLVMVGASATAAGTITLRIKNIGLTVVDDIPAPWWYVIIKP